MFYVAYFKSGAGATRPVTFLYNGGPGSSTVWLHMGAFGPRRVVTAERPAHSRPRRTRSSTTTRACSTRPISSSSTRRARASAASPARTRRRRSTASTRTPTRSPSSSTQFLSKYGRWNSPKYLFGESYGTPRSAVLINELEADRIGRLQRRDPALADPQLRPEPGSARRAIRASTCPTSCAADLRGDGLVPQQAARRARRTSKALLAEVEQFAMADYALALRPGAALPEADRAAHRREAPPVHGPAASTTSARRTCASRRRVREDPAGRRAT